MSLLLTGGAGFIGSHTAVELINKGYDVVIADNLYNSDPSVVDGIEKITGIRPKFYNIDVTEKKKLGIVFAIENIDAVIHFAGYKAASESNKKPIEYYRNNIDSALTVLETMKEYNCKKIIFSSSAAVYGASNNVPFIESTEEIGCTNPYGRTKYTIEQIIKDAVAADTDMSAVILRYFNSIGAHESGLIGEKSKDMSKNLMPYIMQVAAGRREKLSVFGNNYSTHDGTGVRDYIHVVDLAKGHVAAYEYINRNNGCEVVNLGTGIGYSVLDLIKAFKKVNAIDIPYVIAPKREGDVAISYASTQKAERLLGWKANKSLEDMCKDSWRWQRERL